MHGNRIPERPKRSQHAQDVRDQAVVLTFVLALGRDYLTILDLARTLNAQPHDFTRHDAVERAVVDLTGVGLLQVGAGLVCPTAAALRFIEIIESGI